MEGHHRKFDFHRDTFAFRNELHWEYTVAPDGATTTRWNDPKPAYAHHCFVVARSARQFLFHAQFRPELPRVGEAEYRKLIRAIVSRSAREPGENKIEIPGFEGLRQFSQTHERALKEECGGSWQSYFLRSHWRMVFPVSRANQAAQSARLLQKLKLGEAPIVHVFRFPKVTINHALMVIGSNAHAEGVEFATYDPNLPEKPSALIYSERERTFLLPRNIYWAGGRVDLIEVFREFPY